MEATEKSSLTRDPGDEMRLVARIRAGDQHAMSELYDRYSKVVYAVALRVLQDAVGAEDVLQDVFLQLWRNPRCLRCQPGKPGRVVGGDRPQPLDRPVAQAAPGNRHRGVRHCQRSRPAG